MSDRDWLPPFNDYWHKACGDCGHAFHGPKRTSRCHLCNEARKAATPKGCTKPDCFPYCDCLNDSKEVTELKQRIQTLEAEVGRLEKLAYIGEHQFEDCTYKFRLEELRAQPARQVGGDEREETSNG